MFSNLTNFADDNYCLEWNINLQLLVINLEKKLETITKWLRGSGLGVNQDKTEICVFHSNDPPVVIINVDGVPVKSCKSINVLGVIFDSKLNWSEHICNAINKAKKSLFALRLLRKYFTIVK